jgi:predicted alpha/beta hydrolase
MAASLYTGIAPELKVEIPTADGRYLVGSHFRPAGDLRRAVVIAPAMGVGQTFYHSFARFLANRGFTVLTFDYRGIGASARESARSSRASLYDWGSTDIAGVLSWMAERQPDDRLLYVGHSVGVQALGLTPAIRKIQGLVAITAPNGYWRLWSGRERVKLAFCWYVAFPMATGILGYFPAKRLGLGLDLPGRVARDWTRWARTPGYVVDERGRPVREHFQSFHGPVLAYSFTDDVRAVPRSITELLSYFSNAAIEHRQMEPAQLGVVSIGHMGFFRESEAIRTTLWTETSDWLAAV